MDSKHDKHRRRRRSKGKVRAWKFWVLFVATPIILTVGLSLGAYVYIKKQSSSGKQGVEKALIYANLNRHTEALDEFKKELAKNPENAKIHYHMGISYLKLKEYDKATTAFKTAIRLKPNFSSANLQLAVINVTKALESRKLGKKESLVLERLLEAEDICREIIGKDPSYINAFALLAEIHFSQGLLDDAIIDYKHVLKLNNSFVTAHIALARLYMNSRKFDLAEKQCNQVLSEIDPQNYQIRILLSTVYEQQGKFDKAVASLKQILEKKPGDIIAHTQLGLLYLKTSKYDEAFSEAETVSKLSPSTLPPAVYFVKGSVLLQRKDFVNAITLLKEATVRLPKLVEPHYFLALALNEGGRTEEAKSEFKAAINISPGFVPAQLALARLLTKDGWQEETLELCKNILEMEPGNADAVQILGMAYMRLKDFEKAEEQFKKIYELRPATSIGDINMAYLSLASGQLSKCIRQCESIIKANPAETKVYDILGLANIRRGNFDKGIEQFKKAIEIDPNSIITYLNLAKAYVITGKNEEAIETLEKTTSLNPESLHARIILANLYEKKGNIDEAAKLLEKVLEINPDYLPGYSLAGLYFLQGKTDESIDLYNRAIKLDPENAILLSSLALSYQQKENYAASITYYKKAIELKPEIPSFKIMLTNIYITNEEYARAKEQVESIATFTNDQKKAYLELLDLCQLDNKKSKQITLALNKAIYARQKGNFDFAIEECKEAAKIFPENVIPKVILASTYLSANQNEEAIKIYTEIIKEKPESASSYYDLGKAYLLADKKAEAISMYQNVLDLDSKSVPARLAIAGLLLRKGAVDEATKMVGEVIELDPENILAHNLLGEVNLASAKYEKAETEFSRMIELKSDTFEGHFNMARMKYAQGNLDECIEHCKIALQTKPADVRAHNILGMAYLKKGMVSNAVAAFNKIIDINSDFVPAYLNLANINLSANQPDIAALLYKTALKINPDTVAARFGLGNSYALMKNHSAAIGEYETIIKTYPNNVNVHISMARSYVALGKVDKAQESVMNALGLEHENAVARSLLAMIYVKNESISEAINQLNRVLLKNPEFAGAYELGVLYMDKAEYDKSISTFEQGVEHFPDNVLLWTNMAAAYQLKEDYKNAKDACLKAINIQPDGVIPNLCMVNVLLAMGEFESARLQLKGMVKFTNTQKNIYQDLIEFCIQNKELAKKVSSHLCRSIVYTENRWFKRALVEYEEITKIAPTMMFAYNAQVDVLVLTGDYDEAVEICKKAIELEPGSSVAYGRLASIYNRQGKKDEAEAQYRKVIAIDPDNVTAHLNMGMLLETKGLLNESIDAYKKVIELDPSSIAAYNNLAWLYASRMQDKLEDALKLAEKAKELAPNSAAVIDTLGWVYYLGGMYDKAMPELKTAVRSATWNPTIRYHMGMTYYKKGLQREALTAMERALKISNTFPEAEDARELIEKIIIGRIKGTERNISRLQ